LITPDSLLNIHDHVDAETISGSSHGMRNSALRVPESGKLRLKKTASARPAVYWKRIDTRVKTMVLRSAGPKVGSCRTCEKLSQPEKGASLSTNERTV